MKIQNEFTVSRIDLENFTYPPVKVGVWHKVIDQGGSVCVEIDEPRITLHSEDFEDSRDVASLKKYAQELADDWNENSEENWKAEFLRCLQYCAEYEQKQIDSLEEHKQKLAKYKSQIAMLEEDHTT